MAAVVHESRRVEQIRGPSCPSPATPAPASCPAALEAPPQAAPSTHGTSPRARTFALTALRRRQRVQRRHELAPRSTNATSCSCRSCTTSSPSRCRLAIHHDGLRPRRRCRHPFELRPSAVASPLYGRRRRHVLVESRPLATDAASVATCSAPRPGLPRHRAGRCPCSQPTTAPGASTMDRARARDEQMGCGASTSRLRTARRCTSRAALTYPTRPLRRHRQPDVYAQVAAATRAAAASRPPPSPWTLAAFAAVRHSSGRRRRPPSRHYAACAVRRARSWSATSPTSSRCGSPPLALDSAAGGARAREIST